LARSPRRRFAIAFVALSAMLATPAAAIASQPPTILSAGVNAADQLYVTWALGPGTTFDMAQFATAPALEPGAPYMFDLDNALGYECDAEECPSDPAATSYTTTSAVPRDRRYFAMVSAEAGTEHLASAVWVIDDAKPLLAGQPPDDPPVIGDLTIGAPTTGHPASAPAIAPPAPPPAPAPAPAPSASISLPKLPRSTAEILRRGVRVTVTCAGRCVAAAQLLLDGQRLALKRISPRGAGTRTFAVRPAGAARTRLRAHRRARLQIAVTVTPAGGATKRLSRSFVVAR
jgi:hypothetical protein